MAHGSGKTKMQANMSRDKIPVTWMNVDLSTVDSIMYYRGRLHIDAVHGSIYLPDLEGTPLLDQVLALGDYEVELKVVRRIWTLR